MVTSLTTSLTPLSIMCEVNQCAVLAPSIAINSCIGIGIQEIGSSPSSLDALCPGTKKHLPAQQAFLSEQKWRTTEETIEQQCGATPTQYWPHGSNAQGRDFISLHLPAYRNPIGFLDSSLLLSLIDLHIQISRSNLALI